MSDRLPSDPTPEEIAEMCAIIRAEKLEEKRISDNDARATDEIRRYKEYRLSLPLKRVRE
jgi:hypothetical protein